MPKSGILVSVVSHNQIELVRQLLEDMERHCRDTAISVVVTLNVAEELPFGEADFGFPVRVIRNKRPKGFGANHNAAFQGVIDRYFCVVNPDIRLTKNPFPGLVSMLQDKKIGIAAPVVVDPNGRIEDSARRLPTPWRIASKLFRGKRGPDYELVGKRVSPDFVAGMFMLFRSHSYDRLAGFDERYFLYYEDVDICCRARLLGLDVVVNPAVKVVHAARRESHRKWRYLLWHLRSMARFFASPVFFAFLRRRADAG